MAEFLDSKPKSTGFLDGNTPAAPLPTRPDNYDMSALQEGEEQLEQIKARIKYRSKANFTTNIVDRVAQQEDPAAVAEDIRDGEEKLFGIYKTDDIYVEDATIGTNPGYTAVDHRYYRNLQIMSEEFERASVEQEDKGFVGYSVDFVDREIFRQAVFGFWEDLTNRTGRQGQEFGEILFGESDPAKVRDFMRLKVEEARSEGILGENAFAYNQLLREAYSFGHNPDVGFDRTFAALDLAGFVGAAATVGRKGLTLASRAAKLKSTTAATRAGAFGGVDEANKVAANINRIEVDPVNTANMQSSAVDLNPGSIRPSVGVSIRDNRTSQLASDLRPNLQRGAVPDEALEVDLEAVQLKAIENFKKNTSASVYSVKPFDIVTELGDIRKGLAIKLAKDDGSVFRAVLDKKTKQYKPESGAQKFADRIGGVVAPLDPEDLSKGYVVEVQEALNLRDTKFQGWDLALETKAWYNVLGKALDNRFLGGAAQRNLEKLNEYALRSENASKFLNTKGQDYINKLGALDYEDLTMMNYVLSEFRDGVRPVSRTEWNYTDFAAAWMQKTGQMPNDKVHEAFEIASDIEDTAWLMQAADAVRDAVEKGFKNSIEVADGVWLPARRKTAKALDDNAEIVDLRGDIAQVRSKNQVAALGDDVVVWEVAEKWNGKEYYIFPTKPPRIINSADVFGYSAYGRRSNEELQYFTFLLDEDGNMKTVLGSVSKRDGDIAQNQLEAIQEAYKKADSEVEIDEVIAKNNDWNKNINNKADMDAWLAKHKINFTAGKLNTRVRDSIYENPFDKLHTGNVLSDVVIRRQSRAEIPITQFGGGVPYNPDPLESIVKNFGSVAHKYAWNAYTHKSMNGWLDQADMMMKNNMSVAFQIPKSLNPRTQFLEAKVIGSSPEAARMRELHTIIKRQLSMKTDAEVNFQAFLNQKSEELFNLTGKKVNIQDPTNAVLTTGFFSAFAFNLSQMFLQGSAVANVVAIAGWTGVRGMVGQTHLRIFFSRIHNSAEEAVFIKDFSKYLGVSEDKTREIIALFNENLPNVVASDIMELGTPTSLGLSSKAGKAKFMASKVGKKLLDIGYIPFNQGEAMAKSTGFMTAAIEFAQKNPDLSILSEAGRNYIARRSSTLSQNMTMSMRSSAQSGFWRVPSQWLNFFFRSFEQVFVGRDLTKAERARLGFALMPMYGFTGLGMGQIADEAAEMFGLNPESEEDRAKFIALKYGLLDGFVNYFTPFDVALSARMAPATAVWDIYEKFTQENVLSAVGGPSGSIVYTGLEAMYNLVSNTSNGYTGTLTEDSMRILRNFSGINNVAQAVGIIQDDVYRNRRGLKLPVEVDVTDAIIALTGFTPIQVTELYAQIGENIGLNKDFKKLEKRMRDSGSLAWSIYGEEPERAGQILREAQTIITKAPLSIQKKRELLRLLRPNPQTYRDVSKALYDNDRATSAAWFESILGTQGE